MGPLAEIILILISAKVLGELAERAGFPSLVGEISAGILLGPALLGLVIPGTTIEIFSEIGIIALLFISGAQLNIRTFSRSEKAGAVTAAGGIVVPFVLGIVFGFLSGLRYFSIHAAEAGHAHQFHRGGSGYSISTCRLRPEHS